VTYIQHNITVTITIDRRLRYQNRKLINRNEITENISKESPLPFPYRAPNGNGKNRTRSYLNGGTETSLETRHE